MSTITISRIVAADTKTAYEAWVDTEQLSRWWWPQLADTTYELDAEVGGRFAFRSASAGIAAAGTYSHVEPGELLDMTWEWNDTWFGDRIVVLFTALDDSSSEVTVVHVSPVHVEGGGAEQGWNDVMDRLPHLARDEARSRQGG